MTKQEQKRRIQRLKKQMQQAGSSCALLISSGAQQYRSHDTYLPFRQDSDFFYLTGSPAKNLLLLVQSNGAQPVLLSPPENKNTIIWEGKPESSKKLARELGAECIVTPSPKKEILSRLKGTDTLYFQNDAGTAAWEIARELIETPSFQRANLPGEFVHSDLLLERLRLYKSREEVTRIRDAAHITCQTLREVAQALCSGKYEYQIAAEIEAGFRARGAEVAFPTIVAAGSSAATLHHEKLTRKVQRNDLLLIDCGAEYQMYAADITRVFPARRSFTDVEADLYDCVLDAQEAAISKIKNGVRIRTVYNAAAKVLTAGLKDLGILRGNVSTLLKKQAFKPYFPHGIGHSLGIDVHDIGRLRGNLDPVLETGMVFTVEPGLYFPKKQRRIPACGIRIEDDVLVTNGGCQILTKDFPKEREDIEELMGS